MANIITSFRILCSIALLLCTALSPLFYAFYLTAGLSDMADGWVARKTKTVSDFGSKFDTVADIVFVAVCLFKLIPVLNLPLWLWIWAGAIVVVKVINQISALVMYKKLCFPHTFANKATGLLLFVAVPLTMFLETTVPMVVTAALATFAAVQEGHFIRTGNRVKN